MAGDERCEMTDLLVSDCDHCKHGDKQIVDHDSVRASMPKGKGDIIEAQFEGTCGGCGEDIIPGDHIDVIKEITDARGKVTGRVWAHYGCCE